MHIPLSGCAASPFSRAMRAKGDDADGLAKPVPRHPWQGLAPCAMDN